MKLQSFFLFLVLTPTCLCDGQSGDACFSDDECDGDLICSQPEDAPEVQGSCSEDYNYDSSDDENFCFSGHSTVEVHGKGVTPMRDLKIQDRVRVVGGHNKEAFAQVFGFGHYQPEARSDFLQIRTEESNHHHDGRLLEITRNHLLWVLDADAKTNSLRAVPAGSVKIGDSVLLQEGILSKVVSVRMVRRQGVFSPLTTSGEIAVGGILASNYVSFYWLKGRVPGGVLHWLQHGATAFYRLFCWMKGGSCVDETYDEATGYNNYVQFWNRLEQWQLQLPTFPRALFLLLISLPATLAILIGMILSNLDWPLAVHFATFVVGGFLLWKSWPPIAKVDPANHHK